MEAGSTANPFATEEAWNVSTGTILPAGNHACKVLSIDGSATSSGGHPQVDIVTGNDEGQITDWRVVIPTSIGGFVQFTDAVGLPRPADDEVKPDGTGFRIKQEYLDQAVGKDVGVVVRSEPDRNDPNKTRDRVKGYVPVSEIDNEPTTPSASYADTNVAGHSFPAAVGTKTDDDIPF
jgi:hypothetical protein